MSAPDSAAPLVAARPHGAPSLADWLGCAFCVCLAALVVAAPARIGILLLPPVIYELAVAITFLIRRRARRHLSGVGPRIAAYGASLLMPVFSNVVARTDPALLATTHTPALLTAGASLWLFATVLSFWPLWYLRHSFSIEPAARELVTSGPYQLSRHPIYTTHLLTYTAFGLLHPRPAVVLAIATWFLLVCARIRYEEHVLTAVYPEYASYRARVGAFGPRILRLIARAPARAV